MTWIIAAVLMQAPTLEDRVDAFLRGDAGARETLVKLGTQTIRPLQKARDKSPEKVGNLVFELKKGAAYPNGSKVPELIDVKREYKVKDVEVLSALSGIPEQCGVSMAYETFGKADLKAEKVTVEADGMREALDSICTQAGLDYGFFHNMLVIAKPERLWPDGKSSRGLGPAAVERQHGSPDQEKMLKQIKMIRMAMDFQNQTVEGMGGYIKEFAGLPLEIKGAPEKRQFVFRARDVSLIEALSVITQLSDMDFMVHEGKIAVDKRDAIEKMLAGKK